MNSIKLTIQASLEDVFSDYRTYQEDTPISSFLKLGALERIKFEICISQNFGQYISLAEFKPSMTINQLSVLITQQLAIKIKLDA